jgi:hypothetical protein
MIGLRIDRSFAAITAFGLSSPAGSRYCMLCILRLLLVCFIGWVSCSSLATRRKYHLVRGFGWASRSSSATRRAYRVYFSRVPLAGQPCIIAIFIADVSLSSWPSSPPVNTPLVNPTNRCRLGHRCLLSTPLLAILHRHCQRHLSHQGLSR